MLDYFKLIYFNIQRCTYVVSNNIHELFDQKLYNIWSTVIVEIFIVAFWSICVFHSIYLFKTFRIATTFLGKLFFYLVVDRSSFEHLKSPSVFSGVLCWSLVLCVCFVDRCLSLFFWPLCCLSVFDLRILITPLVSSNSSWTSDIV